MQTSLTALIKDTPQGREADTILRSCVHCGFCTASCPTYRLLGDELDGPRGRIYLIKSLLEGHEAGRTTQVHLDRCLGCRACETACPSGVEYARLLDIGRTHIERLSPRPLGERLKRFLLCRVLPYPRRLRPLLRAAQLLRPLLPHAVARHIPAHCPPAAWPAPRHARRALLFEGCVQPLLAPGINAAAARLLDRLGIGVVPAPGCCGALSHHLAAEAETHEHMRRNIEHWWPRIQAGAETLIVTASGCGTMIKDYGRLLRHDPHYADRAERVSRLTRDISEVVAAEAPTAPAVGAPRRIAFHSPCSLTHGQGLAGVTESLLSRLGFELVPVADPGLCCGSAGSYSILQPALSRPMLRAKVAALEAGDPDLIATANIGCHAYLRQEARVPVVHWVELLT
jgi:glycolate oxidase iron-sulfur subunit